MIEDGERGHAGSGALPSLSGQRRERGGLGRRVLRLRGHFSDYCNKKKPPRRRTAGAGGGEAPADLVGRTGQVVVGVERRGGVGGGVPVGDRGGRGGRSASRSS